MDAKIVGRLSLRLSNSTLNHGRIMIYTEIFSYILRVLPSFTFLALYMYFFFFFFFYTLYNILKILEQRAMGFFPPNIYFFSNYIRNVVRSL